MSNMYSIGELIDKLIIENIKIYNLREKTNMEKLSNEDHLYSNNKMNISNENRSVIINFLNNKIDDVANGGVNNYIKNVRTYKSDE